MFPRLAEQYKAVVRDLILSLQALSTSLQDRGLAATCYSCGDERESLGASFVANLGTNHMVRFLVSDFGISWVESRHGQELVRLEGADAIEELQSMADRLQSEASRNHGPAPAGTPMGGKPSGTPRRRGASPLS